MYLDEIIITNFCSCPSLTIPLSNLNPIIGYNNSGKSNILRAIHWLLRKSVLQEASFYNPQLPVIVEGKISNTNINLLPQNQQAQISRYITQGQLHFRRRQDIPSAPAAQVRIDVKNPTTGDWDTNPTGLDNAISALFPDPLYIEAMDDAADDISRFAAKNTIGLLLKYSVELIRQNNAKSLQSLLTDIDTLGSHLAGPNRLQELINLENTATTEISEFFPDIGLHLDIQPPTLDELIKSATVSLSDGSGQKRPFTSFGHGAQRTVQMALIKLLASQINQTSSRSSTVVLLIDEPELYLYPQAIELLRDSLDSLSQSNFQVIFSTHSPLMLANSHLLNTSMVFKERTGETTVRQKLSTAASLISAHPHHSNVIFSLQNSTYLMFSEKILIVEGKTEKMIIPDTYKVLSGRSISQDKMCIIEGSSSSAAWPMIQVLRSVGFNPKAVVDLDYIFKTAPQNGLISTSDTNFLACKHWFNLNHSSMGFFLGQDGFPSRRGPGGAISTISPEQAFERMAQHMPTEISNLSQTLLAYGIWVWTRGAIESHLGIQKNDIDRINFIQTLNSNNNVGHAAHPSDLISFITWLNH